MSKAEALAEVVADTVAALSTSALRTLVEHLRSGAAPHAIRDAIPTTSYRTAVERLLTAGSGDGSQDRASIALALESVAASRRDAPRLSLVWTGPTTDAVSVRRTDQALLQLINRATTRVIVVSFAVYKVPNVAATLEKAARRGVLVDLVVETDAASGGKIAFDGWEKLGHDVHKTYRLWTWAHDRRPVTSSGKLATLHAKCAVADGMRLLVSSANLTEFALNFNIELGLLLSGGEVPGNVARHFDALMTNGDLVDVQSA